MIDDEPADYIDDRDVPGGVRRSRRVPRTRRGSGTGIIAMISCALLAVGVVVLALDMKFEADQARWQQRQTCLEWYRLQADYGVGPWYQKLPTAALDCGGRIGSDGNPLVPGGSRTAVEPGEDRYDPTE